MVIESMSIMRPRVDRFITASDFLFLSYRANFTEVCQLVPLGISPENKL
jgi:hypothetical protein